MKKTLIKTINVNRDQERKKLPNLALKQQKTQEFFTQFF